MRRLPEGAPHPSTIYTRGSDYVKEWCRRHKFKIIAYRPVQAYDTILAVNLDPDDYTALKCGVYIVKDIWRFILRKVVA